MAQGTLLAGLLSFTYGPRYVAAYGLIVGSITYWIKHTYGLKKFWKDLWKMLTKSANLDGEITPRTIEAKKTK